MAMWTCSWLALEHTWFIYYGKLVAGILFFPFTNSDLIVLILYYIDVFCIIDRISRLNRCYIRLNTADSELEILSLLYREMIRWLTISLITIRYVSASLFLTTRVRESSLTPADNLSLTILPTITDHWPSYLPREICHCNHLCPIFSGIYRNRPQSATS